MSSILAISCSDIQGCVGRNAPRSNDGPSNPGPPAKPDNKRPGRVFYCLALESMDPKGSLFLYGLWSRESLINSNNYVIASAMYMEEVRQGTCREAGLGHAGSGQLGNSVIQNRAFKDCRSTSFLAMTTH